MIKNLSKLFCFLISSTYASNNSFDVGLKLNCACNKKTHFCKVVVDYPQNITLPPHSFKPIILNKIIVKINNSRINNSRINDSRINNSIINNPKA